MNSNSKRTIHKVVLLSEREYNTLKSLAMREHRNVNDYIRLKAIVEPYDKLIKEMD